MKKPELNKLLFVKFTDKFAAKTGISDAFVKMKVVYKKGIFRFFRAVEYFEPVFPNDFIKITKFPTIKDIVSFNYVNPENSELAFSFTDYWKHYWTDNVSIWKDNANKATSLSIEDKVSTKMWCNWIDNLNNIKFLETWIDGLDYSDGTIDNPEYTCMRIFKAGVVSCMKELEGDAGWKRS